MKLYTKQEKKLYNYLDNMRALEKDLSDIIWNNYLSIKNKSAEEREQKLLEELTVFHEDLYYFNKEIKPLMRAVDRSLIRKEASTYHEETKTK